MRKPSLSLRGRVTITGTLVVAVLVLVLDVFVYTSLRDQLYSNLERVLDAREQLVLGLRDELEPVDLRDQLDEVGVRAVVRLPSGRSFRSAGAPTFASLPPTQSDESLATRVVPLQDGAEVVVLASRGGIESTLERLLLLASIGSVAVVALAYAVFAGLAARVLRPVRSVASIARHITEGHLDQRIEARAGDEELRDMILAFNDMLDALQQALARSQQAEEVSRRFLADAAHQLRTPAAGIRASVGTMVRTRDGEDRELMLDNLARESARMARLLSSLLRVARLDSREAPTVAPTPIEPLIGDLLEQQRVRAPRLRFDLDVVGAAVADVDASAFAEAVGNLLDNAARHAREVVVIEIEDHDRETVLRVKDDGPGVPIEAQDRVFDRFVSLDGRSGSGLGLPIARGIAEAHQGTLDYEDAAFVLRVPKSEAGSSLRVP